MNQCEGQLRWHCVLLLPPRGQTSYNRPFSIRYGVQQFDFDDQKEMTKSIKLVTFMSFCYDFLFFSFRTRFHVRWYAAVCRRREKRDSCLMVAHVPIVFPMDAQQLFVSFSDSVLPILPWHSNKTNGRC